jgi:hypothetical protein
LQIKQFAASQKIKDEKDYKILSRDLVQCSKYLQYIFFLHICTVGSFKVDRKTSLKRSTSETENSQLLLLLLSHSLTERDIPNFLQFIHV